MTTYGKNGFWYSWIRVWFWEKSPKDGRPHQNLICCFENWSCGVSLMTLHWSWYGVPTWATPAGEQADRKLICLSVKASFYTDRSVGISSRSRSWICSVNHCQLPVRELESSGAFSRSDMKPAHVEDAPSLLTLVRALPRLQKNGNCLGKVSKTTGK